MIKERIKKLREERYREKFCRIYLVVDC